MMPPERLRQVAMVKILVPIRSGKPLERILSHERSATSYLLGS
jgi:hypothetical protein